MPTTQCVGAFGAGGPLCIGHLLPCLAGQVWDGRSSFPWAFPMPPVAIATLDMPTAAVERVWADIYISDTRGGGDRIEILPKLVVEGDRQVIRSITARMTTVFAGKTMALQWTDTDRCPQLRAALDSIAEVRVLAESTPSKLYEGLAEPPPPPHHTPTATVKISGMTLHARPATSLGMWVHRVTVATNGCWNARASLP